jgi:hypothetical protein
MRFFILAISVITLFFHPLASANPYWDQQKVPKESSYASSRLPLRSSAALQTVNNDAAINVLRIQIDWQGDETYRISKLIVEPSGTPALLLRSKQKPAWGSYLGVLKDNQTGQAIYYDSIGTGKEYRKLARAINLRFPVPTQDMTFELYAENPQTGVMEKVVSQKIAMQQFEKQQLMDNVEIKSLALASKTPELRINIYAEGYLQSEKEIFWQHAMKAVQALQNEKFPGVEYMSFYAVFHASNQKLGAAANLGMPIPERDSFLGLYYPYWDNFGRWYNVVYPTRENKFRVGLATAAYDYPLVLVNNSDYWGVGNYMSHTAIPAADSYDFTYLLLHEFGHFFGLNEEYEGGGRTELEFAPDISEPWSQNITFLQDKHYENLKWKTFVDSHVELPTPASIWQTSPPVYGAYRGGYADSVKVNGHSYKPGLGCVMEAKAHFCDICTQAIQQVVQHGLGKN